VDISELMEELNDSPANAFTAHPGSYYSGSSNPGHHSPRLSSGQGSATADPKLGVGTSSSKEATPALLHLIAVWLPIALTCRICHDTQYQDA